MKYGLLRTWNPLHYSTLKIMHMLSCIAGGDAAMEVETGSAGAETSAAGATAPSTAVEEDEDCHATYQLIGVLTHKVHV